MSPTTGETSWIIPQSSGSSARVEITLIGTDLFVLPVEVHEG